MVTQIFVNLPVKDLQKTKEFWSALGFTFNSQFTDDKAACLILGENMYAMLLVEKFFQDFITKQIADAATTKEVLLAIQVGNREEVDAMFKKALAAGGSPAMPPQDHGWMYAHAFTDPDGHHWEPFFMDVAKMPKK